MQSVCVKRCKEIIYFSCQFIPLMKAMFFLWFHGFLFFFPPLWQTVNFIQRYQFFQNLVEPFSLVSWSWPVSNFFLEILHYSHMWFAIWMNICIDESGWIPHRTSFVHCQQNDYEQECHLICFNWTISTVFFSKTGNWTCKFAAYSANLQLILINPSKPMFHQSLWWNTILGAFSSID